MRRPLSPKAFRAAVQRAVPYSAALPVSVSQYGVAMRHGKAAPGPLGPGGAIELRSGFEQDFQEDQYMAKTEAAAARAQADDIRGRGETMLRSPTEVDQ